MTYQDIFFISLIEGLTEFIPVSSTGHMLLLKSWLGIDAPQAETFIIFVQLGAILAVLGLYAGRIVQLLAPLFDRKKNRISVLYDRQRLSLVHFIYACLPVLLAGLLFYSPIRQFLFGPLSVALGLMVGGVIMIIAERYKPAPIAQDMFEMSTRQALFIGLLQCCALWPGVSRSGSTMVAGMLCRVDTKAAADFSFLIAIPIMTLAVGYELFSTWHTLDAADLPTFAFGFAIAFVVALLSVRWFLAILPKLGLAPFGYYRIVLGLIVLALLLV